MKTDKQRERLVELLQEASTEAGKHFRETTKKVLAEKGRFNSAEDIDRKNIYEIEADYLLAKGVIVPILQTGQSVWRVCRNRMWIVKIWKIEICNGTVSYIDNYDHSFLEIHIGKGIFLTREEAENALKGGAER